MAYQHYTDIEQTDADKVDRAIELIDSGQLDEARRLLEQVSANHPEFYVYNFGTEKEVYIKFWSLAEYLGYVALTRKSGEEIEQEVIWLKSAYPRAYYHLAQLALKAGDDDTAAAHLDKALLLEPDHPECLMEVAEISARSGDAVKALEQFDLALGSRPYMPADVMARMYGGKARQLAHLGRYEEAEQCIAESLRHGADTQLAMNLQRYIESVKSGAVTAPVSLDTPPEPAEPEVLEPAEPDAAPPDDDEDEARAPDPAPPQRSPSRRRWRWWS